MNKHLKRINEKQETTALHDELDDKRIAILFPRYHAELASVIFLKTGLMLKRATLRSSYSYVGSHRSRP